MMKGILFFFFIATIGLAGEKHLIKDKTTIGEIESEYGEMLSIIKKDNKVYLECEDGLVLVGNKDKEDEEQRGESKEGGVFFDNCPTIQEVQAMAIMFAGVSPEVIKKLKSSSKYKALFPDFNITYDKSVEYDSGSDKYFIGPNDWKISLTWKIADLIYNPDIITITDRSRYITNLRNEIIKEITTLYFKRKRLIEKQAPSIEIEELTALIDGYTGGWFSKNLTFDKR